MRVRLGYARCWMTRDAGDRRVEMSRKGEEAYFALAMGWRLRHVNRLAYVLHVEGDEP
jgi:hypothetical protein